MVRILVENTFVAGKRYIEAAGLSTDAKPTAGVITGSKYLAVDNGNVYSYDEVSGEWVLTDSMEKEIADAVDAWLDDHPEATTTVQDGAITYAKLNESLQGSIDDIAKKANIDGYYDSMTVGNAEQLISTVGVDDKVPYLFRTAGGSADIGDRLEETIIGGTVAWNQLTPDENTQNTESGDIVKVDDAIAGNADKVVAHIAPVQDLHGQANPYPPGGSVNILSLTGRRVVTTGRSENTTPRDFSEPSVYVGLTMNNYFYAENINSYSINENGVVVNAHSPGYGIGITCQVSPNTNYCFSYKNKAINSAGFAFYDEDGNFISYVFANSDSKWTFETPADCVNLIVVLRPATNDVNVVYDEPQLELGTTPSAYHPYSNICPITGFTGVTVQRTGRNLFDKDGQSSIIENLFATNEKISLSFGAACAVIPCKPNTTYTAKETAGRGINVVCWSKEYPVENTPIYGRIQNTNTESGASNFVPLTITTGSDAKYLIFWCYNNRNDAEPSTLAEVMATVQIELGSTATTYEPYSGSSASVSWQTEAGTVYGGKVDLTTGVLTVERYYLTLANAKYITYHTGDISSLWIGFADSVKADASTALNAISNMYQVGGNESRRASLYGSEVDVYDPDFVDEQTARSILADFMIVYKLATPITYQLTSQQLALLLGTNNVWSSTGSTDLTYTASKKHHTLLSGRKYLTRISGTDSIVTGSGQRVDAAVGTDNVFDLTQMLGVTIADYIATLEAGTAGAGIAWFRNLFPMPRYAYDAGSLQSVQVSAHKTTGFNQWDEEWELGTFDTSTGVKSGSNDRIRNKNPIPVVGGQNYFINTGKWSNVLGYDASNNFIGTIRYQQSTGGYILKPSDNIRYINIQFLTTYGTTYNHDICVSLHWDGERDGEYEAYNLHSYPLDSDLVLRGIPKLDSNNKLYYDGDEYAADGTVTRRFGIVDLGTLTWSKNSDWGYFATLPNTPVNFPYGGLGNAICSKYPSCAGTAAPDAGCFTIYSNILRIADLTIATETAFKTAMDGVYLVYELDTPTTEEADPFQSPQIVDDWGTEEYVDAAVTAQTRDVAIPVGHNSIYQNNLRAKLEMAPESPSGDGLYLVQQENGENTYIAYIPELPTKPTSNGSYNLKLTVSEGTPTLTWEEVTE